MDWTDEKLNHEIYQKHPNMEDRGLKNKLTTICPGGVFDERTSIEYVRQFLQR